MPARSSARTARQAAAVAQVPVEPRELRREQTMTGRDIRQAVRLRGLEEQARHLELARRGGPTARPRSAASSSVSPPPRAHRFSTGGCGFGANEPATSTSMSRSRSLKSGSPNRGSISMPCGGRIRSGSAPRESRAAPRRAHPRRRATRPCRPASRSSSGVHTGLSTSHVSSGASSPTAGADAAEREHEVGRRSRRRHLLQVRGHRPACPDAAKAIADCVEERVHQLVLRPARASRECACNPESYAAVSSPRSSSIESHSSFVSLA